MANQELAAELHKQIVLNLENAVYTLILKTISWVLI